MCFFVNWLQLAHKLRKEVDHDNSEEQAVDAIKDASMPRHNHTTILDVRLALDERFGQGAQRGGYADQKTEQDRQVPVYTQGTHGKEQSCRDREYEATSHTFPGLAGADVGGEFVPPEEVAREERARVETPYTQHQRQQPPEAAAKADVEAAQQGYQAQGPAQVDGDRQGERPVHHRAIQLLAEKEEG